jgi:predicted alpha/beta hydrolase family esterase
VPGRALPHAPPRRRWRCLLSFAFAAAFVRSANSVGSGSTTRAVVDVVDSRSVATSSIGHLLQAFFDHFEWQEVFALLRSTQRRRATSCR